MTKTDRQSLLAAIDNLIVTHITAHAGDAFATNQLPHAVESLGTVLDQVFPSISDDGDEWMPIASAPKNREIEGRNSRDRKPCAVTMMWDVLGAGAWVGSRNPILGRLLLPDEWREVQP